MTAQSTKDSGNVLFLILIAVALFAALSYAITQSTRTTPNKNTEKDNISVAQVELFISSIEQAITRMTIMNGCTPEQISFENTVYYGGVAGPRANVVVFAANGNTNSPSDSRCHIFRSEGGNVATVLLSGALGVSGAGAYARPGHMWAGTEAFPGVGTSEVDIAIVIPYVTKAVCNLFNKKRSIGNANGDAVLFDWYRTPYNGAFTAAGYESWGRASALPTAAIPIGSSALCFNPDGTEGNYHVLQVVLPR